MADQPPPPVAVDSGNPAAVCAECGNTFNEGDMIRHGNVFICANCKPIFMQKLAEGARIDARELHYAGFWIRAGARILDYIFAYILIIVLAFIVGMLVALAHLNAPGVAATIGFVIGLGTFIGYEVLCLGKWGATPGKMIFKLKVVTPEGGPISYLRALGRFFGFLLSGFTLYIGYIMAGFDAEKRSLHDRICNTRVIYTNK